MPVRFSRLPPTLRFAKRGGGRISLTVLVSLLAGCSTLRTTDPARTATEQFLLNEATRRSIDQLAVTPLRDRLIFFDTQFTIRGEYAQSEMLFLVAELRAKLLQAGARVTEERNRADVVVEMRVVGVGIDRLETLFGLPSMAIQGTGATGGGAGSNLPLLTPELAIVKRLRQNGFASIAYIAYWRDSGEIVTSSGPFVGRTNREDFWLFGFGPRTVGDIPPAQKTPAD
jgi:hypothetical protein